MNAKNLKPILLAAALTLAGATQAAPSRVVPGVGAARRAALAAQLPAREAQAAQRVSAMRPRLGLGAADGFRPRSSLVNDQGRTVVRVQQTHQGAPVWGGEAIVHMEASGATSVLSAGIAAGVTVAGSPRLTPAEARAIALRDFAPRAPMHRDPEVELLVFPSAMTGGPALSPDASGRAVLDQSQSTRAHPPAAPWVWAYEVHVRARNPADGWREVAYVVDAGSGAILRKWSEIQTDQVVNVDGFGLYSGWFVPVTSVLRDDGSYSMTDPTRGTEPNPGRAYWDVVESRGLTPAIDAEFYADPGNTAAFLHTYDGYREGVRSDSSPFPWPRQWGNTLNFSFYDTYQTPVVNGQHWMWVNNADNFYGQTAAVDAWVGAATAWDFYKNVFGRLGTDGKDTSVVAVVHLLGDRFDNAWWVDSSKYMVIGDGTWPNNPKGMQSLAELDIVAHEMTHGVTASTAALYYQGESGGLNEATSDILGKMVQAYKGRPTGADSTVPEFSSGDLKGWEVGRGAGRGTPLRFMYHPSLDGRSPDAWYDGIEYLDVHYASGPMNRAFYVLAQGAPADASLQGHSIFLPGGTAGVGNDAAARIWYKALTEHLTRFATYADARAAAIASAQELFGYGSAQEQATWNAFAAINVGAAWGEPEGVRVTVPVVNPAGTYVGDRMLPGQRRWQWHAARAQVKVHADVRNTADPSLTWSWGNARGTQSAGTLSADGTWTVPDWTGQSALVSLKATSVADPRQFALLSMAVVDLDADQDTETDALDLGTVAMNWGVVQPNGAARLVWFWNVVPLTDWDLTAFAEAMRNDFPVR
jgi:Zn-dependent metalloprotease